ncbi:MAG: hypothetical protein ACREDR_15405, partial [Blastocatellia bacterium]
MRQGPGCNRCLIVCADGYRVPFLATAIYVGAPTCVLEGIAESISPMSVLENQAWTGAAASRQPLHPSPTTRREDHVILIVPMSSGRLFLGGLLASFARLRFTGTIHLPCSFPGPLQTGHFYFAGNRTFLLCLDTHDLT